MELERLIPLVRESVEAIISKPKMADKLLSKPPFRFLHDTISAITAKTGFAEGLYAGDELDSAGITDRDAKINYLDKIFKTVGICTGTALDVRAAKVVAGLEPENTNAFLLALAECAVDASIDSAAAVRRCLDGEQPGQGPPAKKASTKAEAKTEARVEPMREKVEPVRDEAKPSRPVEVEAKRGVAEMKRDSKDDSDSQPLDRGRSRGGTRGGKQGVLSSDSAGLGHLNNDSFPNLDKEIEACDGSEALTQSLLGDLIKKPKLTEKLLSKPPFRFLFDIFTEVVQATGFSRGLYTVEEQDSSNVQEKEAKVLYLEKMIKLIGIHLNTVIEARPVKIVAGLEAQNTNVLLQLLAVAARHRPDSSKSVMLALEQLNVPVDAAAVSRAAPAGKSEDKSEIVEEPRTSEPVRESRARVQEDARAEEKPKAVQRPRDVDDDIKRDAEPEATDGSAGAGGEVRRSMRPTTALRRPPKVAASAKEVSAQETVVAAKKTQGLIVDGQTDDDEEIAEVDDTDRLVDEFKADAKGVDMGDPQSKLVKDILSRQAEQEASRAGKISDAESKIDPADDGKSTNSGIRLGRLRKTGADKKGGATTIGPGDIEKLRATVQVLVQHTGPLGSCMDFIQEDVGVMTSELRRWEEDCVKYETRLEEEKLKTQALLKPLNMELLEMTEQVNEQQERISSLKACIARKEEMILLNLKQVVSSSY